MIIDVDLALKSYHLHPDITQHMGCIILLCFFLYLALVFFVFFCICFIVSKYWHLFEYARFQSHMQVQQHIYLQDNRTHSVAVSQSRNDHMQVYIFIMEDKYNNLIWNCLSVDRLTGPRLMFLWNAWSWY